MTILIKKTSSFESVIPTALTVLEPMQITNLPFVKEFFKWLDEKPKVSADISGAVQLEARHVINNELVKREGITQMLELASGFFSWGRVLQL